MRPRARRPAPVLAVLLCLGLGGCDSLPGRPSATRREISASEVVAFDVLYGRHCAGCHGTDGRWGAARPLNDPVYLALVPVDRLRRVIGDGVPGTAMPAAAASAGGSLTAAQVDALVEGILARWRRAEATRGVTLPPYEGPPATPGGVRREQGSAVYARACARCHGPDGRGGTNAASIVDPSYLALVSDQSLRTTVIAGRPDLGKPDWRDLMPGRPLTPLEISDVVAWLAGHRRPVAGRPGQD